MSLKQSTLLPKKSVRDSNIELLRILAILGVIILHYNNDTMGGGFAYVAKGSINRIALYGLESLCICAVNLFVLITGFFSCNAKRADLKKVAALLIQVSIFRTVPYLFTLAQGAPFSVKDLLVTLLPANWFVMLYVGLYLLSPYINVLLHQLSDKNKRTLLIVSFVLFSIWPSLVTLLESYLLYPVNGLNTVALTGGDSGYTLVQFLLMYLIGAYIRLTDFTLKPRCSIPLLLCSVFLITLESAQSTSFAWSYCNPLVILAAVAMFTLFRQFRFQSRVINALSKSAFTCYLAHMYFLKHYHIAYAVNQPLWYMVCHILFTAVTVYLFCFITYEIYSLVFKPISMLFRKQTAVIRTENSSE